MRCALVFLLSLVGRFFSCTWIHGLFLSWYISLFYFDYTSKLSSVRTEFYYRPRLLPFFFSCLSSLCSSFFLFFVGLEIWKIQQIKQTGKLFQCFNAPLSHRSENGIMCNFYWTALHHCGTTHGICYGCLSSIPNTEYAWCTSHKHVMVVPGEKNDAWCVLYWRTCQPCCTVQKDMSTLLYLNEGHVNLVVPYCSTGQPWCTFLKNTSTLLYLTEVHVNLVVPDWRTCQPCCTWLKDILSMEQNGYLSVSILFLLVEFPHFLHPAEAVSSS